MSLATTNSAEPRDKADKNGKISLRYAGKMRHLGIGRAHIAKQVLLLIHDQDVTVSDAATGEVIACHHIDPNRDYRSPAAVNPRRPGQPRAR